MANTLAVQTLVDGVRNYVAKVTGQLTASDEAYQILIDPSTLTGINFNLEQKARTLQLVEVNYSIEDPLTVQLYWDNTTPVLMESFTGRGKLCGRDYGGFPNNGGAGNTGKIGFATQGWTTGAILNFSLTLEFFKVQS